MLFAMIALWMATLQSAADAPWGERFPELAEAITTASKENPVFGSPEHTAAVLTAVAYFESNFNPEALGDCKKGEPKTLATCQSVGAFQISKVHASADLLIDPLPAARQALRLIARSKVICRQRPLSEALSWYASGGPTCSPGGARKSGHRMALAARLLRD